MAAPRTATFSQTQSFAWADGSAFNGAAIIGLVIPTVSGTSATVWPKLNLGNTGQVVALPKSFARVPIAEGKLDSSLGLLYNADIVPTLSQYVHYLSDSTGKVITPAGTFFTVSTSPITLPTLALPNPSQTNAVAPVPN